MGNVNKYLNKLTQKSFVQDFIKSYNKKNKSDFINFRTSISPMNIRMDGKIIHLITIIYGLKMQESNLTWKNPHLEILTREHDLIIFKHCYPVSKILPDTGIR